MPTEERSSKGADRCSLHPGEPSVATCEGCGRALCVSCATPVRGLAYGAECLAVALGEDAEEVTPGPPWRDEGRSWHAACSIAFVVAAAATVFPWSRFGEGSRVFGAWGSSPRWSILAAVAALAGLVGSWLRGRRAPGTDGRIDGVLAALAVAVFVGSALAIARPPYASRPALAPWVAATAGAAALGALIARRTSIRARHAGV